MPARRRKWDKDSEGRWWLRDEFKGHPDISVCVKPEGRKFEVWMYGPETWLTIMYKRAGFHPRSFSLQTAKKKGERVARSLQWLVKATGAKSMEIWCFTCEADTLQNLTADGCDFVCSKCRAHLIVKRGSKQ